uniref:Interleukin-7 n=1 Tax=Echeneis naucrates TaxID=173247 RepID=A0A665V2A9_ECHNA
MPLLCISLLALLLLPLSLSCSSTRPLEEVQRDYMEIVRIELDNTRGSITALLNNSPCPVLKQKLRHCTANISTIVSILHSLACKMKNLSVSQTDGLAMSLLNSIRCPCPGKLTNEPNTRLGTATRKRRNNPRKSKEAKNLCKTKAILSAITDCYEMLNSRLMDT